MIRFEHVSFQYKHSKKILNDYSLEIPDCGRICLSAPSGKGKSTVFRLILGLERPTSGHITGIEGRTMSAVFQDDRLIPWKTVLENIMLFADTSGTSGTSGSPDNYTSPGISPAQCSELSPSKVTGVKEYTLDILKALGLAGTENLYPKELSGGMARRVCLARALCHGSELLVLDEAFTGLDDETKRTALTVTDQLARNRTLIMASHDLSDAEALHAEIINLP